MMGYSHTQHTFFFYFNLPHSYFDEVPGHMAGEEGHEMEAEEQR